MRTQQVVLDGSCVGFSCEWLEFSQSMVGNICWLAWVILLFSGIWKCVFSCSFVRLRWRISLVRFRDQNYLIKFRQQNNLVRLGRCKNVVWQYRESACDFPHNNNAHLVRCCVSFSAAEMLISILPNQIWSCMFQKWGPISSPWALRALLPNAPFLDQHLK